MHPKSLPLGARSGHGEERHLDPLSGVESLEYVPLVGNSISLINLISKSNLRKC